MQTISDKHRALYRQHYAALPPDTVLRPHAWTHRVIDIAQLFGVRTILDYGSGPERVLERTLLEWRVSSYDPALEFEDDPAALRPADLLVCHHVLEHVELELLDAVVIHLRALTHRAAYIAIGTQPSTKTLPDGTPWHTIVQGRAWWRWELGFMDWRILDLPPQHTNECAFLCVPGGVDHG